MTDSCQYDGNHKDTMDTFLYLTLLVPFIPHLKFENALLIIIFVYNLYAN